MDVIILSRKFTYKEIKDYIEIQSNSGCKLLSTEYRGTHEKMIFKCKCGNNFETTFDKFKSRNKRQCNNCGKQKRIQKKKLPYDEVKNFIETESNSGCKLLSEEYIGAQSKLDLVCKCGRQFKTSFSNFKSANKRQCNDCGRKNIGIQLRKTNREFIQEVFDLVGDEYKFLEEYTNSKAKIKCRHNTCGYIWGVTPNSFLRGSRCPNCFGTHLKTQKQFEGEIYGLTKGEYTILGTYINTNTKIGIRHNVCGYEYMVLPTNFLNQSQRCPQCAESKGEQAIRLYLERNNINFQVEYSFEDLLGVRGGLLRFDFAIFGKDDSVQFLIEYDGEFHFKQQYDDDGFEDFQIHDEYKNQYCKSNDIPLLRIPYWEFDSIEKTLSEWLGSLNKN